MIINRFQYNTEAMVEYVEKEKKNDPLALKFGLF